MRTRVDRLIRLVARAALVLTVAAMGLAPEAFAQPPSKPAGTAPLARYFPRQDLVVYVEFDGLDAHRDAWTKSATYRLLNETTTGAMLEQSMARFLDLMMASQIQLPVKGRELVALGEQLLRSGFAVGINRAGGAGLPRCLALVVRGGAAGAPREVFERFLRVDEGPRNRIKLVEKPGGRKVRVLGDTPPMSLSWWTEGDDLVVSLVSPGGVDAVIAALDGREPSAVDHPTRTALKRGDDVPGFEPVALAFFDMSALPPLPREAAELGLDRIKRIDYRWGFHGPAIQGIIGVVAPAPRTGIPALFDEPTFDVRHLPPLPGGLAGFTVLSLDSARLYDRMAAVVRSADPRASRPLAEIEDTLQQLTGLNLRDEVLAPLGSRVVVYTVPTKINAPTNMLAGFAHTMIFIPKSTIVIEVKDREAVSKVLDALARRSHQVVAVGPNPGMSPLAAFNLGPMKRLKGSDVGYFVGPLTSSIPFPIGMRPTVLMGRKEVVLASSPATARRARDLIDGSKTGGLPHGDPLAGVLDQLPDRLTFLNVNDTRQSMLPDVLVSLPSLVETLASPRGLGFIPFFGMGFRRMIAPGGMAPDAGQDRESRAGLDPELIPEPDALRAFLFPSVSAMVVDDQGIRFLSREAFPTINPSTAVPVAIAMLLPAVSSARLAARRAQSVNNLKQIGLALHNFHSVNNHFPADIRGKDGKPLLSWRVQILPFIEQSGIFNEFKLDEPWDSPHNKALLERMPVTFAAPNAPAEPGMTFYRGFSGNGTLFDPTVPKGVGIASITDGTSNTIGVVEAREAVPWTKPGVDIPFDVAIKPEKLQTLRDALGGHPPGGFNALFCDGSVRFIKDSVNLIVLRALITRNGGEVISSDSF